MTTFGIAAILFVMVLTMSTIHLSSRTKTLTSERKSKMIFVAFSSVLVAITAVALD